MLLAEEIVVAGEVADPVLLPQRAHAEHEDARHDKEMEEAMLPLYRVRHQPQRPPPRRRAPIR